MSDLLQKLVKIKESHEQQANNMVHLLEQQLQQAQAKAERYKEALKNIEALEFFTNFNDEERFNAALYHAKRALEGEE